VDRGQHLLARWGMAMAADTVSIAVMELVDNGVIVLYPGATEAGLSDLLFWGSLALSLVIAFVVTVPVNRWMIGRGKGACRGPRSSLIDRHRMAISIEPSRRETADTTSHSTEPLGRASRVSCQRHRRPWLRTRSAERRSTSPVPA
jgi:hypothetical protein